MRRPFVPALLLTLTGACAASTPPGPRTVDPSPATLADFRAAVQKVLDDTGVPGAGIALVRQSGVEWAGGVGLADRDRRTPVTADTHFRAGSISKTFIAMALVQLYEDGKLDLDAPVSEVAPNIEIVNQWDGTDPVRIIHLLQHTAGFDDMHFNEAYNLTDPPDLSLEHALAINPRSRIVRWRPGTRMSYSNPGYGVAGFVIEQVTGQNYEEVLTQKILGPAGMVSSSFVLSTADEALMAKGYESKTGPPVALTHIYLRPAGNLHTSPADLGKFVHLLLNWGETPEQLIVDPEYLSNMEHPRTTLASSAGLMNGYGSAIFSTLKEPFPLLGHRGGINGFISSYAYSPSRDVGYVVLLNATYSREAMERISSLAIRYLKSDVEPPEKPHATVALDILRTYEGYYQDAAPRLQAMAFLEWLTSGRTISVDGDALSDTPVFGKRTRLIPVSDNLFRVDTDVDASRVFAPDDLGRMVLTGPLYAERIARWRVEIIRWPVLVSCGLLLTPIAAAILWLVFIRRATPIGFWRLKASLLLCTAAVLMPVAGIALVPGTQLGVVNAWTAAMFLGPLTLLFATLLSVFFTIDAWLRKASRSLRIYAAVVSVAAVVVSSYLVSWGVVGFRPWNF
jgi:CubicO group peptidase (beta-lactamase class C family)